jgi:hypothetical protein
MLVAIAAAIAVAGCEKPSTRGDGGNGQSICPDHAEQCSGKCCGSQCLDVMRDPLNCGDCGMPCPMGQVCHGGHCGCPPAGIACGFGQTCCGGLGCVNLDNDIRNCGICGNKCGDGAVCDHGTCKCGGVVCPGGQTCCGGTCMASCGGTPVDMAGSNNGAPPGYCGCADHCATDPNKECVAPNCCWFQAFVAQTCMPSTTCAPYVYP